MIVQDISAFLPPGYKLRKEDTATTENSLLSDILAKSKVDISSLLPPDYSKKKDQESSTAKSELTTTTTKSVEVSSEKPSAPKSIQDLFAKSNIDISSLLPRDYEQKKKDVGSDVKDVTVQVENSTEASIPAIEPISSTAKPGGLKIVFPSRPGGRKPIHKITTPQTPRGEGPGTVTPKIQRGWPTR